MRVTAPSAISGRRHVRASLRDGRDGWYRIRNNVTSGHADVWLFDEIGYWGVTAADFAAELKTITAQQITLHINSPGGEVFDGLAIYNSLKAHPANVHVRIEGLAASAASFIAMAGDRITCARNATMMIHDASGLCVGNAADMRELADLLDRMSDNIADIYARRCGGTVDWWRSLMRAETWYTGAEAVAAGLADEQTDPDEPDEMEPDDGRPAEMDNRWDLSFCNYAGREAAPPPPIRPGVNDTAVEVEPTPDAAVGGGPAVDSEPEPVGDAAPQDAPTVDAETAEPAADQSPETTSASGDHTDICEGDRNTATQAGPQSDVTDAEDADEGGDDHGYAPATAGAATDATNGWASLVTNITTPADPWAELTAHLAGDNDQQDPLAQLRKAAA